MVMREDRPPSRPVSLVDLAAIHAKIGLLSFGGGLSGLIYREVVLKKRWLAEREFLSGLAICQILPGANVVNLAVFVGQKLRGLAGAITAVGALLVGPFFIVVAFALLYSRIISLPWVSSGLDGITAAAIGLLIMVVVRGARASWNVGGMLVVIATAVAVGILHLPLIPVVLVVAPVSIGLAFLGRSRDV